MAGGARVRDVAQFFKVLADEARLQILWLLFNHRELCVCDIMEALGITQSKASRHLATLRHADLVVDRREGAWSYYSLRAPESDLERKQLESLRAELTNHTGAALVLRALHEWLERKGPTCPPASLRPRPARRGDGGESPSIARTAASRAPAAAGRRSPGSAPAVRRKATRFRDAFTGGGRR
jgi:ArsR family transcriptional regulator, arsenate/arsenite/antimonite-responsive transcriptional repressor